MMDTTSSNLEVSPAFERVGLDDLQRFDLHCSIILISQWYKLRLTGWGAALLSMTCGPGG